MEKLTINRQTMEEIFSNAGRKLVGKVCKRFEVLENKQDIKNESKELIYESFRDLLDNIYMVSKEEHEIVLVNKQ
jgi:hypothetical protein